MVILVGVALLCLLHSVLAFVSIPSSGPVTHAASRISRQSDCAALQAWPALFNTQPPARQADAKAAALETQLKAALAGLSGRGKGISADAKAEVNMAPRI
jgi:hypothetical protein